MTLLMILKIKKRIKKKMNKNNITIIRNLNIKVDMTLMKKHLRDNTKTNNKIIMGIQKDLWLYLSNIVFNERIKTHLWSYRDNCCKPFQK